MTRAIRNLLGIAALAIAASCHAGPTSATTASLQCLTAEVVDASVAAESIEPAWNACRRQMPALLGSGFEDLTDEDRKAVLATFMGPLIAPYGSQVFATAYDTLAASPVLYCGGYVLMTSYILGDQRLDIVSFDGGAVANHSQLLYSRDNVTLLLDPTVGLVARTTYNDLMRGVPVPPEQLRMFYPADGRVPEFAETVKTALLQGQYEPDDLLAYYEDRAHLIAPLARGGPGLYITPGGVTYRANNPPT